MHQAYAGMVIESNTREYAQILEMQLQLILCKSQNDVAQSCISRGDVLIGYQNAIQELVTERDTIFRTFQFAMFTNPVKGPLLNQQISKLKEEVNELESTYLAKQSPADYCSVW